MSEVADIKQGSVLEEADFDLHIGSGKDDGSLPGIEIDDGLADFGGVNLEADTFAG